VLTVKFKRFAGSRWGQGRWVRALPVLSPVLTLLLGVWMCHEALKQRPANELSWRRGSEQVAGQPHGLAPRL
jgi:hypothetical protein